MANILPTPSLIPFPPFDPAQNYTAAFLYTGNQPVKNQLVISENDTHHIVYQEFLEIGELKHTIEKDTLKPGIPYLMQIRVFDAYENSSNLSEPLLFYCFSTPSFSFETIRDNDIYSNADLTLSAVYTQKESENLQSLTYLMYSSDRTLLKQSETYYTLKSHTFFKLKNKTDYYFRAVGETVHGIALDTGYVKVHAVYETLPANIIFGVENNYCEGSIRLTSGIRNIPWEFENDSYTFKDGLLTLKNNSLSYKNGFELIGDFTLFVEAKKLPVQRFLTTDNDNLSLSIVNICNTYYCRLTVKDSNLCLTDSLPKARIAADSGDYIVTDSGKLIEIVNTSYEDDDLVIFEVRRIGCHYGLRCYYKSEIEHTE